MYIAQLATGDDALTPQRILTPDDYLAAARLIAGCKNDRLKIVLNLLIKGGWDVGEAQRTLACRNTAEVGLLIRKIMTECGLSWAELSSKTGIADQVLRSYRDGRRFPKPERYEYLMLKLNEILASYQELTE